ncbi:hypothetical protein DFH08DRAFT_1075486 [Mycena albidolilacea]|uniref:Uncharacterized protein n=1 Tax=Mycena albidolilacea TaxID=1033008 RepID=A0AAD7AGX5_9AGAR|nr:hypothetical protein DFH08DRAFT_1075486 [Mycena albidolilacea]
MYACILYCHFIFPVLSSPSTMVENPHGIISGTGTKLKKPRTCRPSAWVMKKEEILMQALADEGEDARPDEGAIEIDSEVEYHHGTGTVEEGAKVVRLATLADDGETGTYTEKEGPLPW